jgi:hypothetical protein
MKRLIFALLGLMCLSALGCELPGDPSPVGGPGATYDSNTVAESGYVKR